MDALASFQAAPPQARLELLLVAGLMTAEEVVGTPLTAVYTALAACADCALAGATGGDLAAGVTPAAAEGLARERWPAAADRQRIILAIAASPAARHQGLATQVRDCSARERAGHPLEPSQALALGVTRQLAAWLPVAATERLQTYHRIWWLLWGRGEQALPDGDVLARCQDRHQQLGSTQLVSMLAIAARRWQELQASLRG